MDQSINQSINRSINQPINHQSTKHQKVNPWINLQTSSSKSKQLSFRVYLVYRVLLKLCVDFNWQSVMVSGIVYVFMAFVVHGWSGAPEFTNLGGPTGALTTIGRLFIFLILLKIGWKVSTCVRMTPVKAFLNQNEHSFKSYDRKSKCSIYVNHWMWLIRFRIKIFAASDTESDYAIHCSWVLSLHLSRWEQCMYNRYPVGD